VSNGKEYTIVITHDDRTTIVNPNLTARELGPKLSPNSFTIRLESRPPNGLVGLEVPELSHEDLEPLAGVLSGLAQELRLVGTAVFRLFPIADGLVNVGVLRTIAITPSESPLQIREKGIEIIRAGKVTRIVRKPKSGTDNLTATTSVFGELAESSKSSIAGVLVKEVDLAQGADQNCHVGESPTLRDHVHPPLLLVTDGVSHVDVMIERKRSEELYNDNCKPNSVPRELRAPPEEEKGERQREAA
jgi:hypothetical protein